MGGTGLGSLTRLSTNLLAYGVIMRLSLNVLKKGLRRTSSSEGFGLAFPFIPFATPFVASLGVPFVVIAISVVKAAVVVVGDVG